MREPKPADTPINEERLETWRERFEGYRYGVTQARIERWLTRFGDADKDVAARLLDAVELITAEEVHAAFRALLGQIPGWHRTRAKRKGRFAFVSFSSSSGESGDTMIHQFRLANELNKSAFNSLFTYKSDLLRGELGAEDTVVFIDDFVGSGTQAVNAWERVFQELTTEIGNVYLATIAAYKIGSDEIKAKTRVQLLAHRPLGYRHSLFRDECEHFTPREKQRILHYCELASPNRPKGFGDCALAVVLYHQCPNNSLAVLHASSRRWDPLFPRT